MKKAVLVYKVKNGFVIAPIDMSVVIEMRSENVGEMRAVSEDQYGNVYSNVSNELKEVFKEIEDHVEEEKVLNGM